MLKTLKKIISRRGTAETPNNLEEPVRRDYNALLDFLVSENLKDYDIIDKYPLSDPWAYAYILERRGSRSRLYYVAEVSMSDDERGVYEKLVKVLEWELKPYEERSGGSVVDFKSVSERFIEQARRIVKVYSVRLAPSLKGDIDWSKVLYHLLKNTIGYGPLDPLMRDPYIEDISCDGVRRPVYVWHQRYESIPTNIVFETEDELDSTVLKLTHKAGKHVSSAFPIVDAILPEGHRFAATFRKEVSVGGSTFTIRKFREKPLSIVDLITQNTLNSTLAAYLWIAMEHRMPGIVMGVTGAGKTSMLNALATLLKPSLKVVTIEDTPELRLTLENWVQLVSRPSYSVTGSKVGEVSLYDLVKVSLRYRPDVIIVGEVRGEEAYVLFQAVASVSRDTPIIVRETRTGKVMLTAIGDLVDKFYESPDEERVAKPVQGYETLSHEGFRVKWSPIRYVLRHKVDHIYVVEAEYGVELKATGSHSVFVLDEETLEIKVKRVEELRRGDLLITFQGLESSVGGANAAPFNTILPYEKHYDNLGARQIPTLNSDLSREHYSRDETITLIVEDAASLVQKLWRASPIEFWAALESVKGAVKKWRQSLLIIPARSPEIAALIVWLARMKGLNAIIMRPKNEKSAIKVYLWRRGSIRVPAKALIRLLKLAGLDEAKLAGRARKGFVCISDTLRTLKTVKTLGNLEGEARKLYSRIFEYLRGYVRPVRVRRVSRRPYDGFVYDISAPGSESFFGGNVPVLLHNTGHGGLTTAHAESVYSLVKRLTSPPMNIPQSYIPLMKWALLVKRVTLERDGAPVTARRVTATWEIREYNDYKLVSTWNPAMDVHSVDLRDSMILREAAQLSGISYDSVLDEVRKRALVLDWLASRGERDYRRVAEVVYRYYMDRESVIASIKSGVP
ncbi:MAG: ATPase, T2SS/T4P/T4SS family [Thermoprotei archaeon]|nr:ATPase, T2SS/T4P/T4SS family [Thermoprotei archaeon]